MLNKKFLNKKSQIGSTLTWLAAFFIIFFIIIIFLASTAVLAAKKAISPGREGIEEFGSENLRVQRNLINFLNSPFDINGKSQKTSEALVYFLNSNDETEKIFILNESIKKLNLYCGSYKLLLPNGLLTENGFGSSNVFDALNSKWTSAAVLKINYNEGYKIKYKELIRC